MYSQTNGRSQIKQLGFTLIEAVIAFAIAGVGVLAVVGFQTELISTSAQNKARAEALQLAQQRLEAFKNHPFKSASEFNNSTVYAERASFDQSDDEEIKGTNAEFDRDYTLTPVGNIKDIVVRVGWTDVKDGRQEVFLDTSLTYESQSILAAERATQPPSIISAAGTAIIGVGTVDCSDENCAESGDGTAIAEVDGDLKLVIKDNDDTSDEEKVVLTLKNACISGTCTQFVQIRGSVYLDNATQVTLDADDINVLASNAAYCQRFYLKNGNDAISADTAVVTNMLSNATTYYIDANSNGIYESETDTTALTAATDIETAPTTASNDYDYFRYTCYLGGGWHGNIGILLDGGNSNDDRFCLGDPNAAFSDDEPAIAARRIYRGMTYRDVDAAPLDASSVTKERYTLPDGITTDIKYYSHGIKDGAQLDGHDFVIAKGSKKNPSDSGYCVGDSLPTTIPFAGSGQNSSYMTRTDSDQGRLFAAVPSDWYCLNEKDLIEPELPYGYEDSCPYDPSSPPNTIYAISGTYTVYPSTFSSALGRWDLDPSDTTNLLHTDDLNASPIVWSSVNLEVNTSQSKGNCTLNSYITDISTDPNPNYEYYSGSYTCSVYDWPDDDVTGWAGHIIASNSQANLHCQTTNAISTTADLTASTFSCREGEKFTISGDIANNSGNNVSAITVNATSTSYTFEPSCTIADDYGSYQCTVVVWTDAGIYSAAPIPAHTDWSGSVTFTSTKAVCHDRNYPNVDSVTTSDAALFDDASKTATYTTIAIGDHINEDIELKNTLAQCASL